METAKELLEVTLSAVNPLKKAPVGPRRSPFSDVAQDNVFSPLASELTASDISFEHASKINESSISNSLSASENGNNNSLTRVKISSKLVKEIHSPILPHTNQTPTPPPALQSNNRCLRDLSDLSLSLKPRNAEKEVTSMEAFIEKNKERYFPSSDDSCVAVGTTGAEMKGQKNARCVLSQFGKSCSARQVVYPVYQKDNQRDQMAPCYQQNTLRDMAALAATSAAAAVVSATGAKSLLGNDEMKFEKERHNVDENRIRRSGKKNTKQMKNCQPHLPEPEARPLLPEIRQELSHLKKDVIKEVQKDNAEILEKLNEMSNLKKLTRKVPEEKQGQSLKQRDESSQPVSFNKKNMSKDEHIPKSLPGVGTRDQMVQTLVEKGPSLLSCRGSMQSEFTGKSVGDSPVAKLYNKLEATQSARETVELNIAWMERDREKAHLYRLLNDPSLAAIHEKLESYSIEQEGALCRQHKQIIKPKQNSKTTIKVLPSKMSSVRADYERQIYGRKRESSSHVHRVAFPSNKTTKKMAHESHDQSIPAHKPPTEPTAASSIYYADYGVGAVHVAVPLGPPRIMPSSSAACAPSVLSMPVTSARGLVKEEEDYNPTPPQLQMHVLPSIDINSPVSSVSSHGTKETQVTKLENGSLAPKATSTPSISSSSRASFQPFVAVEDTTEDDCLSLESQTADIGNGKVIFIQDHQTPGAASFSTSLPPKTTTQVPSLERCPGKANPKQKMTNNTFTSSVLSRIEEELLIRILSCLQERQCTQLSSISNFSSTFTRGQRSPTPSNEKDEEDSTSLIRQVVCDILTELIQKEVVSHQNKLKSTTPEANQNYDYSEVFESPSNLSTGSMMASGTPPCSMPPPDDEVLRSNSRDGIGWSGSSVNTPEATITGDDVIHDESPVLEVATPLLTEEEDPIISEATRQTISQERSTACDTPDMTLVSTLQELELTAESASLMENKKVEVISQVTSKREICLSESESSSSSTTVLTHHSEPSTSSTLSTEPPISMGQYLLGSVGRTRGSPRVALSEGEVPYSPSTTRRNRQHSKDTLTMDTGTDTTCTSEDGTASKSKLSEGEIQRGTTHPIAENLIHKFDVSTATNISTLTGTSICTADSENMDELNNIPMATQGSSEVTREIKHDVTDFSLSTCNETNSVGAAQNNSSLQSLGELPKLNPLTLITTMISPFSGSPGQVVKKDRAGSDDLSAGEVVRQRPPLDGGNTLSELYTTLELDVTSREMAVLSATVENGSALGQRDTNNSVTLSHKADSESASLAYSEDTFTIVQDMSAKLEDVTVTSSPQEQLQNSSSGPEQLQTNSSKERLQTGSETLSSSKPSSVTVEDSCTRHNSTVIKSTNSPEPAKVNLTEQTLSDTITEITFSKDSLSLKSS